MYRWSSHPHYLQRSGVPPWLDVDTVLELRGGPIKNHRLRAFDGAVVTFRYVNRRRAAPHGKPPEQTMRLAIDEFLRRWSEHVPVEGFHLVRRWGLYAATQRPALARCRQQLFLLVPPAPLPEPARRVGVDADASCPVCGRPLVLSAVIPRAGAPQRHQPTDNRRAA